MTNQVFLIQNEESADSFWVFWTTIGIAFSEEKAVEEAKKIDAWKIRVVKAEEDIHPNDLEVVWESK